MISIVTPSVQNGWKAPPPRYTNAAVPHTIARLFVIILNWVNTHKNNSKGEQTHRIPEGVHLEPLKQLLANFHGVRQEGPVGQQEVLDVCGVHDRWLLHQVHDQTFWGSLLVAKRHQAMRYRKHRTHACVPADNGSWTTEHRRGTNTRTWINGLDLFFWTSWLCLEWIEAQSVQYAEF